MLKALADSYPTSSAKRSSAVPPRPSASLARAIRQRARYSIGAHPTVALNRAAKAERDMPATWARFATVHRRLTSAWMARATIGPMPLVAIYAGSKCAVEGFTESLAYELHPFGIAARLVEPGYAPTTIFTANGGPRMAGLIPPDYGPFAEACFAKMADYPTAYCSEQEVAEAIFAAATDEGRAIRYPAGADSKMLAGLRWSTSEEEYLRRMREMFEPALRRPSARQPVGDATGLA